MTFAPRRVFLKAAAATAASSFLSGCVHQPSQPAAPTLPAGNGFDGAASLGAHAAARNLLYGCAVSAGPLARDLAYATLIREQARIVVAENAMKWGPLRPTPDTFRFEDADALVAFAEANHQKIRGHNLCWHRQNPAWLDAFATPANARNVFTTHITTVAGRYAGRMHSWDVVNEAVQISDGRADGLRLSPWLKLIGDDYIELAFRTARDADPQALLTYNDYGIEDDTPASEQKRQAILVMLRRMLTRHVPIDAVGIQSHISASAATATGPATSPAPAGTATAHVYGGGLLRFIAAVRELGLQVFLTEMDVNDGALPLDNAARDTAVAATYRQYLDLVLADPAVRAVLTWGITDHYTWLNGESSRADKQPERPLPFDSTYLPKPATFAMRDAFDRRPISPSRR
jgi:endo-1,4-beta-xylanase